MLYLFFNYLIQPLINEKKPNIPEFTTFISSIIGASGSIIGGIIGGLITGYVAFKVARFQIDKDSQQKELQEHNKKINYKKLILNEIKQNNICLKKIHILSPDDEVNIALKYSLSNQIFNASINNLEVDDFFVNVSKYYRILNRLMTDTSLHSGSNHQTILEEIATLIEIESQLQITPTTK